MSVILYGMCGDSDGEAVMSTCDNKMECDMV